MSSHRGFSLVEVVVAIGVIAAGLVAVIGLMAAGTKMIGETVDRHAAERALANCISELERVDLPTAAARLIGTSGTPASSNLYYESRDGTLAGWGTAVPESERFFAVELYRLESISPAAADASGSGVALLLRVIWPVSSSSRSTLEQTHVLLR